MMMMMRCTPVCMIHDVHAPVDDDADADGVMGVMLMLMV